MTVKRRITHSGGLRGIVAAPTIVSVVLGMVMLSPSAQAGVRTEWTGAGDGYTWADGANWSAGVPGPADTAVLDRDNEGECANVEGTVVNIAGLELTDCAHLSAGVMTVADALVADASFLGADTTVTHALTWKGSSHLSQDLTIPTGATMRSSGVGQRESFGLTTVHGTLVLDGGTTIAWNDSFVIDGTTRVDSSSTIGGGTTFVTSGPVQVGPNTLSFDGHGYEASYLTSGTTSLAGGQLLLKDGMHEFREGARFTGTGLVRASLSLGSTETNMRLSGHGDVLLDPGITFEFAAGYQHDPMAIQGGTFAWTGGNLGNLTVGPTTTATVSGSTAKSVFGSLVNQGTMTLDGGSPIEADNDGIRNDGTLVVAADTVVTGGGLFSSTGTLSVRTPLLTVDGPSFRTSGDVMLEGAKILLESGSHELGDGTSIDGTGTMQVASDLTGKGLVSLASGVTLVLDGGSLDGTVSFAGGTLSWMDGPVSADLTLKPGTTMAVSGEEEKQLGGDIVNDGTVTLSGEPVELSGVLLNRGVLEVLTPMELTGSGTVNNAKKGRLTLTGKLKLAGPELVNAGRVQIGTQTLALGVGAHVLKATSTLGVSVNGQTSQFGALKSGGALALDGALVVTEVADAPAVGSTYGVVTAMPRQGKFEGVSGTGKRAWTAIYAPKKVTLKAH